MIARIITFWLLLLPSFPFGIQLWQLNNDFDHYRSDESKQSSETAKWRYQCYHCYKKDTEIRRLGADTFDRCTAIVVSIEVKYRIPLFDQ